MRKKRKILATLLTFAMLFGTTLSVRAEGATYTISYEDNDITGITIGQELTGGSTITVKDDVSNNDYYMNIYDSTTYRALFRDQKSCTLPTENNYKVFMVGHSESLKRYTIYLEIITPDPSDNPSPSEPSSPSTEPAVPKSKPHEHSYSWVTVQEATTGQDGIEEYRCSCGAVAERSVIPASQALVNGLFDALKNAPQNGPVKFDTGRLYTLSDYLIKKLAERNDATIEITFEYEKKPYKMVIPAGVDYAALLDDEENFYGYFYFAKVTGARIEER